MQMEYEDYFFECWNHIDESIVSDEYYDRNQELLSAITYDLFYLYDKSNAIPPAVARQILKNFCTNLTKFGIR